MYVPPIVRSESKLGMETPSRSRVSLMNRSGIQPYQKSKQHLREPEMQQSLHLREPDLPQAILQKSVMIDQSSIRQSTVFSIEIDLDAEMKMAGKTIKFDRTPKKDKPKE
jgi:hypothetical protein